MKLKILAADALQLHPNRISELCRRFGGDTFQHILEKKRLDQAKRFLEKSKVKIEAVALMCGFSGVTYFTRVFGRSTGMSPGKWRGGASRRELPQRNEPH